MLYFSRWKTIGIWLAVAVAVIFAAPNLIPQHVLATWPDWLPKKQMTLGLDLQGGSHILLEVVRQDIIDERLNTTRDEIRTKLRDAKIGYTGLGGSGHTVQVRIRDADDVEKAKTALADLLQPVASGVFGTSSVAELSLEEPEPGPVQIHADRCRHRLPRQHGGDAVDRGRRPPRQRARHDRADHPAPGRRPHPRAGAGPSGPAAAEGHSRPDRQADLPDGRSVDAGRGGHQRPSAGRLVDHVWHRRSAGAVSDRGPRHRLRREPHRRAGDASTSKPANRSFPSASTARAHSVSARRRSRMSAVCLRSSSTIR